MSPFEHIARMPLEEFTWARVVALTAVAVALTALGLDGFSKRDVEGN